MPRSSLRRYHSLGKQPPGDVHPVKPAETLHVVWGNGHLQLAKEICSEELRPKPAFLPESCEFTACDVLLPTA